MDEVNETVDFQNLQEQYGGDMVKEQTESVHKLHTLIKKRMKAANQAGPSGKK